MTTVAARSATRSSTRSVSPLLLGLVGLGGAVALRMGVGGTAGVRDPFAGLVFALALGVLAVAVREPGPGTSARRQPGRRRARAALRPVAWGVAGAAVLCAVPLVVHLRTPGAALDPRGLPVWAAVVTAVAVAEEAFLRGALWDAAVLRAKPRRIAVLDAKPVSEQAGATGRATDEATDEATGGATDTTTGALLVTTVAFALLHVPFYGWDAVPLDLAVGMLLGGLRLASGGWAAPAVAHTVADLAGWWLR